MSKGNTPAQNFTKQYLQIEEDTNLNWSEKFLLCKIISLLESGIDRPTNTWLAQKLGSSELNVRRAIYSLVSKGYLITQIVKVKGQNRKISFGPKLDYPNIQGRSKMINFENQGRSKMINPPDQKRSTPLIKNDQPITEDIEEEIEEDIKPLISPYQGETLTGEDLLNCKYWRLPKEKAKQLESLNDLGTKEKLVTRCHFTQDDIIKLANSGNRFTDHLNIGMFINQHQNSDQKKDIRSFMYQRLKLGRPKGA